MAYGKGVDTFYVRFCIPHMVAAFDTAWAAHLSFCEATPRAATPYRAEGWHWPNTPTVPGLMASIDQLR